jgi:FkbM family methyltransferase
MFCLCSLIILGRVGHLSLTERQTKVPTLRQSLVASLTRLYPFYSGCGTFANKPFVQRLAGATTEHVWCHVPGGEVLAPLHDYVGRAAFYVGDLDRKITWICAQIVKSGDTVLDIGANIGLVSLCLSKLVGDKGTVHAFEPNPALQTLLRETLARNRAFNVRLHPIALGAEQGQLKLRIPKWNMGAASLSRNKDLPEWDCDVQEVPVSRLSDIVAQETIRSIRFIKIDVEGFEAEVFRGGQDVLREIRPEVILFEMNGRLSEEAVSDQPVIKILHDFGYEFLSVPKCLFRMHLKRFTPGVNNQPTGNDFLAVLKGECYEKVAKLVDCSG